MKACRLRCARAPVCVCSGGGGRSEEQDVANLPIGKGGYGKGTFVTWWSCGVHVCVHARVYVCVCTCACARVRVHVCVCTCPCARVRVHVRVWLYGARPGAAPARRGNGRWGLNSTRQTCRGFKRAHQSTRAHHQPVHGLIQSFSGFKSVCK